ncbi:unnamed protein product [Adineta ricciae]|uniref:G-protein coupled receptors family 1 profile domain-containing protein n=1 Tax=Adineta ricciae TaxID=249248 RepID=A0A813T9Z4_ADIRI|nr:unnamed protein product [Adineta ricciae]CAF0811606.1 unnamed protein product [Adineta ricciae]
MEYLTKTIDWICVILFTLGFIGNLLGLVVFSSRRFRCCSTYVILALSSFAINLVCIVRYSLLLHSTARLWLTVNVVDSYWLACKFFRLSTSFRVLSAWVTVFWVIERFVYVSSRLNLLPNPGEKFQFIEKYKYLCMTCASFMMIIIVSGPITYFYAPYPSGPNVTESSTKCTLDMEHTSIKWKKYFTIDSFGCNYHTIRFLFSEIIPSILVGLFNICIIICILRTTAHVRRRQEFQHNQISMSMVTGTTSKLSPSNIYDSNQQRHPAMRRCSFKGPGATIAPMTNAPFGKMSWMNMILILHSILFFLSFSASSLVHFWTSNKELSYATSIIILASCSLNFYVYCLSGAHFRTELKRIAKRYIRNLHKKILRHCYKHHHRRHSTTPNGKEQLYFELPLKQDPLPTHLRQYQTIERMR